MSYTAILLAIVALEILRRICISIYTAFFTPLSKVPGPLSLKLCGSIWLYHTVRGNTINIAPKLFKRYGDVVRIGPNEIMVSSKSAIQKIVIEEDFKKSPLYTLTQEDPHVSNLFTETDTRVYKQKVCCSGLYDIAICGNGLEQTLKTYIIRGDLYQSVSPSVF